jgi:phosphatidylglycerophosphate synthase
MGWLAGSGAFAVVVGLLAIGLSRAGVRTPRPADWITLTRGALAAAVTALVVSGLTVPVSRATLVAITAVALLLDAFDGWVARATGTASELGARFDMEVDAFLIAVLSVQAARSYGAWVLLIGGARYALLAAERMVPWLRRPVPPRYWRKVVAAIQGIALTLAISGLVGRLTTVAVLVGALALLAESFGRDVWWLARRRADDRARSRKTPAMVLAGRG